MQQLQLRRWSTPQWPCALPAVPQLPAQAQAQAQAAAAQRRRRARKGTSRRTGARDP
jgi:hypothetical protein